MRGFGKDFVPLGPVALSYTITTVSCTCVSRGLLKEISSGMSVSDGYSTWEFRSYYWSNWIKTAVVKIRRWKN